MTNQQPTGETGGAAEVQDFYERYPYPRPVDDLDYYRRLWSDPQRRRAEFHLFWPDRAFREDFSILVAGCGTSQAAKYALRWPNPRPEVFGYHEVFHLLVIAAAAVQYGVVLDLQHLPL